MDRVIKDNLNFIEIPRVIRKKRLLMEAKALQQNQQGEEHYTSDIKPYYHDICYGRYYCDDYKWKIIEDEHTGEILCEYDN